MQGTIHLSDPPLYVGLMRVEILIVITQFLKILFAC